MKRLFNCIGICIAGFGLSFCAAKTAAPPVVTMKPTAYDDGRSCPNKCDAHVVFKARVHNGTLNAFLPARTGGPYSNRRSGKLAKCQRGKPCAICFGTANKTCMLAVFRGNGPRAGRFDFTPNFMKSRCKDKGLPAIFARFCTDHIRTAARLAAKVNCIKTPTHRKCAATMKAAGAAKKADQPKYALCKRLGQRAYNKKQTRRPEKRANDCAYFRHVPACSAARPCGIRLAPAACQAGYYVGKDGLDCCSADPVQAAIDQVECGIYYR
jgi:hypothetical protein